MKQYICKLQRDDDLFDFALATANDLEDLFACIDEVSDPYGYEFYSVPTRQHLLVTITHKKILCHDATPPFEMYEPHLDDTSNGFMEDYWAYAMDADDGKRGGWQSLVRMRDGSLKLVPTNQAVDIQTIELDSVDILMGHTPKKEKNKRS